LAFRYRSRSPKSILPSNSNAAFKAAARAGFLARATGEDGSSCTKPGRHRKAKPARLRPVRAANSLRVRAPEDGQNPLESLMASMLSKLKEEKCKIKF
jgi:hypothetical protein